MKDLTVTVVQADLVWEDVQANLKSFSKKIEDLSAQTDLIILPEMFNTGFSMDPKRLSEEMDGPTMTWMANMADLKHASIAGSLIIQEDGHYFNRFVWMHPGGMYQTYDKRHLFTMAGEHHHYVRGEDRLKIKYKGWRICPMICYDLRFPVWSRNNGFYDLLIYVANWPDKRAYDWRTLLAARAIENQAYVVGVNRVGIDGNNHHYSGHSAIIDPGWHKVLWQQEEKEAVHTQVLSAKHLLKVREQLPFLADQDDFVIL